MAANQALVCKLYKGVIEDVISGVRDAFNDEGVDEQVLMELKQIWENKLTASKAIDPIVDPAESSLQNKVQQTQQSVSGNATSSAAATKAANAAATAAANAAAPANATAASAAVPAASASAVRMVPVQITVPAQPGSGHPTPKSITVQVPAHALQGGAAGAQLQSVLSSPTVTAALSLPVEMAQTLLQQHINQALQVSTPSTARSQAASTASRAAGNSTTGGVAQVDGPGDTSDEDDDDVEDEDDDVEDEDERDEEAEEVEEENDEEPLNSEDDVTDEDPSVLFETDNVVVCQYDKITRSRNRWKFHLKDGIMNINGRDYVFQKANGDAEW